jgi:hypothetical protein
LPLGKDVQQLPPDIACRPDNRDPITHEEISNSRRTYRKRRTKAIWLRNPRGQGGH